LSGFTELKNPEAGRWAAAGWGCQSAKKSWNVMAEGFGRKMQNPADCGWLWFSGVER